MIYISPYYQINKGLNPGISAKATRFKANVK